MELGFFTMPLHPPGSDITRTLDDDLEQMIALDQLGYQEAWIGEHFTTVWENIPAPDLFIARALPLTRNMVLGTGVTCMPNHNPFMIAHRIAQLDHMAHGRFYWGVGSGGFPGDFQVFGFDPATGAHRNMTRDAIDVILQIWNDPRPGVYEHKYWRFTSRSRWTSSACGSTSSPTRSRTRPSAWPACRPGRTPWCWPASAAGCP